jgi:type II secretory pathway component PulF
VTCSPSAGGTNLAVPNADHDREGARIQDQEYVLPAIQREFTWSTDQVTALFDSLMRGYPIGSFLFWQVKAAATAVILVLVARVRHPNRRRLAASIGVAAPIVGTIGNLSAFVRWQS